MVYFDWEGGDNCDKALNAITLANKVWDVFTFKYYINELFKALIHILKSSLDTCFSIPRFFLKTTDCNNLLQHRKEK